MSVAKPQGLLAPFDVGNGDQWQTRDAAHLLRRSQFGYTSAELELAIKSGPAGVIERLLSPQPESVEFQQSELALRKTALATGEINDLKIWWLYRMWASPAPLTEKMSLLWHNHFATSFDKVRSVRQMLNQNDLIRQHAQGDFRVLLHGISRDPAMLVWLDGNANRKRHPNENFAREIMELFALGVGNYTEKDIQEAARAFSGWHVREGEFWFNQSQHDQTPKTVFGQTGEFDGTAIVDLCLGQPACARFIAAKLLKAFVSSDPPQSAIDAVAARIRVHDFQMRPVLREVLASQLFFDEANRRSLIKSPVDLIVGTLRSLATNIKWQPTVTLLAKLGQDVFVPPSVKGWEGGRLWINSSSILHRTNFATELASTDKLASLRSSLPDVDGVSVVQQLEDLLLGGSIDDELDARLTEVQQETDGSSSQKLRATIQLILSLPEYQLF